MDKRVWMILVMVLTTVGGEFTTTIMPSFYECAIPSRSVCYQGLDAVIKNRSSNEQLCNAAKTTLQCLLLNETNADCAHSIVFRILQVNVHKQLKQLNVHNCEGGALDPPDQSGNACLHAQQRCLLQYVDTALNIGNVPASLCQNLKNYITCLQNVVACDVPQSHMQRIVREENARMRTSCRLDFLLHQTRSDCQIGNDACSVSFQHEVEYNSNSYMALCSGAKTSLQCIHDLDCFSPISFRIKQVLYSETLTHDLNVTNCKGDNLAPVPYGDGVCGVKRQTCLVSYVEKLFSFSNDNKKLCQHLDVFVTCLQGLKGCEPGKTALTKMMQDENVRMHTQCSLSILNSAPQRTTVSTFVLTILAAASCLFKSTGCP